jgi:hypothetical protein
LLSSHPQCYIAHINTPAPRFSHERQCTCASNTLQKCYQNAASVKKSEKDTRDGVYDWKDCRNTDDESPGRYALTIKTKTPSCKAVMLYKNTAKPRNTLPHSAAMLRTPLGTKTAVAAPPWVELEPVAPMSPKPAVCGLPVREAVADAVEIVGMDVFPR